MIKVKNIETGEVFDVIKVSGEYWIDETGYIESEQLGITWELIDDYKQLYQQQKQRADELENHVKNLEMDSYLSRERADIYKNKVSELEKRWSELKEIISSKYNVINDASFKTILLFVTLLMKDLEEDDNA